MKNLLFILCDDMGAWALGCAGNPEIATPHLDRLAEEGMRFDQFYCSSPVCSPARASILTGRMPSQHGVHDWIQGGNRGSGRIDYLEGQEMVPDVLAAAGYRCAQIGKWHLGASDQPRKAFSHWVTTPWGGGSYRDPILIRNGRERQESGYLTDLLAEEAMDFIGTAAREAAPFCCHLNFTAPHSPWVDQHPPELVAAYDACRFESCPQETPHPWYDNHDFPFTRQHAAPEREWIPVREHLKGYFAAITAMDRAIGRVLQQVDRLGIRSQTMVWFMSDNGFNCGHHGIWGKGCGTFPLNFYDSSIQVPAIVSCPGSLPEAAVRSEPLSQVDLAPTLLDWLGYAAHWEHPELPGKSFAALLRGEEMGENRPVLIFEEYGPARMIRTADWKYIHRYPYGPHELYHLASDPGERHELLTDERIVSPVWDQRGEIRDRLLAELETWFRRYVHPEFDGVYQPVMGRGQTARIDRGQGRRAFRPRERASAASL